MGSDSPSKSSKRFGGILLLILAAMLLIAGRCPAQEDAAFFYGKQGAKALNDKDYDFAIGFFSEAIALCTNYSYAYYSRGQAYHKKAHFDDAIADFTKAISFSESTNISGHAFGARGCVYYDKNDLKNAVSDYSKAIQIIPGYVGNYINRGLAYGAMSKYELAKMDFDEAIKLSPTNFIAYYERGVSKFELKDFDQAVVDLGKALQLDSTNWYAHWARARAYTAMENYSNAIIDYNQMDQIDPENSRLLALRGSLYSKIGHLDKGLEDCKHAFILASNDPVVINNYAWLLSIAPDAKLRDGKKAVVYATKACELTGWKDALCLGTMSAACAETGDFTGAVKWQAKGIEIGYPDKELKEAKRLLALYKQNKPYHAEQSQAK